jgi:hypothetical protein
MIRRRTAASFFFDGNGRCTPFTLRRKKNNIEFGYMEPAEAWQAEIMSTNSLLQNIAGSSASWTRRPARKIRKQLGRKDLCHPLLWRRPRTSCRACCWKYVYCVSSTHSTSSKGGHLPPSYCVRRLHMRHFAQTIQPAPGTADKRLHSPASWTTTKLKTQLMSWCFASFGSELHSGHSGSCYIPLTARLSAVKIFWCIVV